MVYEAVSEAMRLAKKQNETMRRVIELREPPPDPSASRISALEAENERLRLAAGLDRQCVACGKVVDAAKVKRGDALPECTDTEPGPTEGFAACTFDATPAEAVEFWQQQWRGRDAEIARLSDPIAVHRSMLAGTIAKPSLAQIAHLYPDVAELVEAARDMIDVLPRLGASPNTATAVRLATALARFKNPS